MADLIPIDHSFFVYFERKETFYPLVKFEKKKRKKKITIMEFKNIDAFS